MFKLKICIPKFKNLIIYLLIPPSPISATQTQLTITEAENRPMRGALHRYGGPVWMS